MQILRILKQNGPTSRIDIANQLELTRAAVTIITNEMIQQGIIVEVGEYKHLSERAPRGRKKILIDINQSYRFILGIIIEEKFVGIGLSTLSGDVLDKRNFNISKETDYAEIMSFISISYGEILTNNCLEAHLILGIGLAVYPTMFSKMNVPAVHKSADFSTIKKSFSEFTSLPIVIDNSVKGTAMANIDFEKNFKKTRHDLAFLQYGESFNFVFANLHDPIISYDNRTNFVDNIIINPYSSEAPDSANRTGSVRAELTPSATIQKAKRMYSKDSTPILYKITSGNIDKVVLDTILDAYHKGEPKIAKLVAEWFDLFAVLINNLVYSTGPQRIVLHNFKMCEGSVVRIKETLNNIGGSEVADIIMLSSIETKNRFLSGSSIAIRELFYNKGGFDIA